IILGKDVGSLVSFQGVTFCSGISLGYLVISKGNHWPTTQSNETKLHHWKSGLAAKEGQFRLRILH
ncbi:hypothetical protein ACQP3D_28105, partial [Escherichia coli]